LRRAAGQSRRRERCRSRRGSRRYRVATRPTARCPAGSRARVRGAGGCLGGIPASLQGGRAQKCGQNYIANSHRLCSISNSLARIFSLYRRTVFGKNGIRAHRIKHSRL
jgi:hypothetical protein